MPYDYLWFFDEKVEYISKLLLNKSYKNNPIKLKKLLNTKVSTGSGRATIKKIYVTDLGYIMVKLFYFKNKSFINYKIGDTSELVMNNFLNVEEWLDKINIEEKLISKV